MPAKTRVRAVLLAAAAAVGVGLAMPASAAASTNPVEIYSTYMFDTSLTGHTTFKVTGRSGVDVAMTWGGGPTEAVRVELLRKRTFGYVSEGFCVQVVYRYGQGWCHINARASQADHVLFFSKNYDGHPIAGRVFWH